MELNIEPIIKALECCNSGTTEDCAKCPRFDSDRTLSTEDCMEKLMRDALSLIKELTKENERLKKTNEYYSELEQGCFVTGVKKIEADTVRKMPERLHKRFKGDIDVIYTGYRIHRYIDQIAKEMTEDA